MLHRTPCTFAWRCQIDAARASTRQDEAPTYVAVCLVNCSAGSTSSITADSFRVYVNERSGVKCRYFSPRPCGRPFFLHLRKQSRPLQPHGTILARSLRVRHTYDEQVVARLRCSGTAIYVFYFA